MRDSATASIALQPIPLIDLPAQRARLGAKVEAAIGRVLGHGQYIMGPEVFEAERRLSAHGGARHVITCASGTDALVMGLMAMGVERGDAVFVPSFTFTATAEAVVLVGATPVFVDVHADTYNLDPASLEREIQVAQMTGLKPACVIPVDLFGQPADFDAIKAVAEKHDLWILDDAAQSYGARYRGRALGTCADITATSFYPSKPLSCYGDGGALFTDDDELARRLMQIRVHGQAKDRNDVARIGLTGRFDSIQAAVLLEKLAIFDDECAARVTLAARYSAALNDVVMTPRVLPGCTSVWAHYTITSPRRDRIVAGLQAQGIGTAIFYAKPIHEQTPYRGYPVSASGLAVTNRLAQESLCLPMHPYLTADAQDRVIAAVRAALA